MLQLQHAPTPQSKGGCLPKTGHGYNVSTRGMCNPLCPDCQGSSLENKMGVFSFFQSPPCFNAAFFRQCSIFQCSALWYTDTPRFSDDDSARSQIFQCRFCVRRAGCAQGATLAMQRVRQQRGPFLLSEGAVGGWLSAVDGSLMIESICWLPKFLSGWV